MMTVENILARLERDGVKVWVEGENLRFRAPRGVMTDEERDRLREQKREIVAYLKARSPREDRALAPEIIDRARRHEPFPLTELQQAYWIGRGREVELGKIGSHVYLEVRVERLDLARATNAFRKLIEHHDMLRAVLTADGRQRILKEVPPFHIAEVDLSRLSPEASQKALEALREELSHRMYDPSVWPLFDVVVTHVPGGAAHVHLSFELMIVDVWSIFLLLEQWSALLSDPAAELPRLELSFRDYVLALERHKKTAAYQNAWVYWQKRAAELPPGPELPLCDGWRSLEEPRVRRRMGTLDRVSWARLKERASEGRLTPNAVLVAVFAEVLARWSKRPRFTISMPLFNRLPIHPDVRSLVGDFTTVELLSIDCAGEGSFVERARRIQATLLEDLDHQAVNGVDVLRERMRLEGGAPKALFPVVFTSTLGMKAWSEIRRLWGDLVAGVSQTPQVYLDHQVYEFTDELMMSWDVWEGIFPEGMIDAMFAENLACLERLARDEGAWLEVSPVRLPADQARAQARVNETSMAIPEMGLQSLIEEQIERNPGRAVVIAPERSLTFGELGRRARAVADRLIEAGVARGELVACVMHKGWEQIVAVLGVLRAGGAYLPIDASLPPARVAQLLEDAGARIALTQQTTLGALTCAEGVLAIPVSDLEEASSAEAPSLPPPKPTDLAYVIYTSGSTGQPKGVMIDHRGAINTVIDINARFGVGPTDRVLGLSSLSFDLSVYDIFGVLGAGGALVLPDAERARDPGHWLDLIDAHGVTLWNTVPQMAGLLTDEAERRDRSLGSLRLALLSGDWIPVGLPDRMRRRAEGIAIISLGGATEASIWSIYHSIDRVDPAWRSIPYGIPLANQMFCVLDERLLPRPAWVPGELFIGGRGLAQGYWRDAVKTRQRFIEHPLSGLRLYRTGDMGRYMPDGSIEFLGREDNQVKIRGYRVELGEIEAALGQHEAVEQAVTVALGDRDQGRTLVAYIAARSEKPLPNEAELRAFASARLPDYMVPARIVTLDSLPLTPNGKVDRGALPKPWLSASKGRETDAVTGGEALRIRRFLTEKLAARLDMDPEGIDVGRPLVHYGMDSMSALRTARDIEALLGTRVEIRWLWQSESIQALAEVLAEAPKAGADSNVHEITPDFASLAEPFPLTELQRAYWFGRSEHIELGGVACHIYIELESRDLDIERLERAFRSLIDRHGMLRAVLTDDGRQRILPEVPAYQIRVADLRALEPGRAGSILERTRAEMSHRLYDTTRWPLFEIRASRLPGEDGLVRLHVSFDMLIADVTSFLLMLKELRLRYENPAFEAPPLTISFRDYVLAEQSQQSTAAYARSLEHWRERVASLPQAPELPLAQSPAAIKRPVFERRRAELSSAAWTAIRRRAQKAGVTPAMVLCAAYAAVLARWSKHPRFTLNLTLFNRLGLHADVDRLVGDFTSVVLLEADGGGEPSIELLAKRLQSRLWEDLEHRRVSGVRVLGEWSRALGSAATAPVVFTCALGGDADEDGTRWLGEMVYGVSQTPQVWLDHQVVELGGKLIYSWDALAALFPGGLLDAMFEAHRELLEALGERDDAWTAAAPCRLPEAQKRLRSAMNDTSRPVPPGLLHGALFTDRLADREQLAIAAGPSQRLRYGEFVPAAKRLAHILAQRGFKPGDRAAILAEKGLPQIIAVLAVLAAGGVYVPLSPSLPAERVRYVLEDTGARLVLRDTRSASLGWDIETIDLEEALKDASIEPPALLAAPASPTDLAYIIFTSGSTGRPKGVMIEHRSALNTCIDINERFGVSRADRIFGISALDFDLSVYDIFGSLAAGAALVLPDPDKLRDPAHWLDRMREEGVTVWNSAPALITMLLEHLRGSGGDLPASLRLVMLSGDWVPIEAVRDLKARRPDLTVVSLGGATEASIWSIFYSIDHIDPSWRSVPYGRPLKNQTFHVLDSALSDCPTFTPGQLHIGGIGLARGYWNDPALTASRFIEHPKTGERLYATGDQGRYLPDGHIEFLGREDFQVKIRGHRIELGEIEVVLRKHARVRDAVVWPQPGPAGSKQLVAYVVPEGELTPAELLAHARESLPEAMIPQAVVLLDRLPVSKNGKLDRKALPPPNRPVETQKRPETDLERRIAAIFTRILGVTEVGIDQSFFDVGGYSQLAVRLILELNSELGIDAPVTVLFEAPTIEGLARRIAEIIGASSPLGASNGQRARPDLRDDELYAHYARRAVGSRLKAIGLDKHYVRAEGNYLTYLEGDREIRVLDMIGGYGSTLLGHNPPEIVALARGMLDASVPVHAQFSNAHAAGALAKALSDRLEAATGNPFVVTLASSGTEAVEAAIKHAKMEYRARGILMARKIAGMAALLIDHVEKQVEKQIETQRSQPGDRVGVGDAFFDELFALTGERSIDLRDAYRTIEAHNARVLDAEPLFAGLEHAFHGMTTGALSLTASDDFRAPFHWMGVRARLIDQRRESLEALLDAERSHLLAIRVGPDKTITLAREPWTRVCAFLIEPIQGEGGIHPVSADFINDLRYLADANGFPIIVDEIQAGMGRTGFFTAAEALGLRGDYYTFSKSLGGGLSKVSAMAVRAGRYQEDFSAVHGSTYAEDAPGCRIALETLNLLGRNNLLAVCAEKGARFIEKLSALREAHPEIIHAVRGMGLMLAIEVRAPHASPSLMLRTLSQSDPAMFNQLIAGYLLNVEGIRVAPTRTRRAIRFLPSVLVTDEEMDRVVLALARVCEMIEKLNVGRLIRYMVARDVDTDAAREEPIRDWRPDYPPLLDDEPEDGEPRVAHVGHIEDAESMLLVEPSLAEILEQDREELLMRFVKVAKPSVGQRLRIRSAAGSTVHVTIIGMLLTSAMVEKLMRSDEREMIIERVDEAISLALSLGCEIVGLGGYTSIVTLNCTAVARPDAALTSGNAFTAALGLEGIDACLSARGLSLADVRVGVVGAKGNIGSICARILAEGAREIVLVGRDAKDPGLLAVAELIRSEAPDPARACSVHVTDDMHELRGCDVVLSSSNASTPVIHARHLSPRVQVICDIATPRDVGPDVAAAFPGLTLLSGGLARLPEARGLRLLGTRLPADHIFGCVAETALLGLHGHKASFSFGAISPEQVKFIQALGRSHGFRLGGARALEGG